MENQEFSEKVLNSLSVAAKELASEAIKKIFVKIKKHADDPVSWPLRVSDETKEIASCQRALDAMMDILDGYGISYMEGVDFSVIDLIEPEDFEDDVEDDVEEDRGQIMTSESATELSRANMLNKLFDTYDFVSQKIKEATYRGEYKIFISTVDDPIKNDPKIIKNLVKKMIASGYHVSAGDKVIDTSGRPEYTKMKKIMVRWG